MMLAFLLPEPNQRKYKTSSFKFVAHNLDSQLSNPL
jgi:hypothetical protein